MWCASTLAFVVLGPTWIADDPACPSAEEVAALADEVAGAAGSPSALTARVSRSGDGYVLELDDGTRVERVESESCHDLAHAAVVIAATREAELPAVVPDAPSEAPAEPMSAEAADPVSVSAPTTEASAPAVGEALAPRTGPARASAVTRSDETIEADSLEHRARRRPHAELRLGPTVGGGALPGPYGGGSLALGVAWSRFLLEVGTTTAASRPVLVDDGTGRGGRLGLVAGSVRGCVTWSLARWSLGPCAALEAGASWVVTRGEANRPRVFRPWVAAKAEGRATWWPSPRVGIGFDLGGAVALRRESFRYGRATLFAQWPVDVRGGAHIALRFGSRTRPKAGKGDR